MPPARARTEADLHAAIERAQHDLDGIVAVFQALLRIAEIEAGARRSAFARVDLGPLLFDLAELYTAAAEENGQVLEHDIPPILPAFGDRDMLQQAVANLLDNALKFSPPGSTIRLAGRGGRAAAGNQRGRPGARHPGRRPRPRDRAVLPRRERAQHARLGARACRWCRRWRCCTAARCGWKTTGPACAR